MFHLHSVLSYQKLTDGHKAFLLHFKKRSWTIWQFTYKREDFISAAGCLWGHYATFKLKGIIMTLEKVLAHIIQHEGLQHCLTAKPSGIRSTELSIVWYPGSSPLRMKIQAPFHFTNSFMFLLLLPAVTFLPLTLDSPLIRNGMEWTMKYQSIVNEILFIWLEIFPWYFTSFSSSTNQLILVAILPN